MKQILSINIVRFNNNDLRSTMCCFDTDAGTSLETIKDALVCHLKENKNDITNACLRHYEEGEKDGFEEDRQNTYDSIISSIKTAQSLNEIYGHWDLEDGLDQDTFEQIFSHITISSVFLKQV